MNVAGGGGIQSLSDWIQGLLYKMKNIPGTLVGAKETVTRQAQVFRENLLL